MVDRIASLPSGRTTMSVIPGLKADRASEKFEDVLETAASEGQALESDVEYGEFFEAASKEYGVPLSLLLAVAKAESSFNPNDVSRSGAMGIMQLMPGTAKELGVKNAFDPEENIMGGAKYLSQKLLQYGGNLELTLAAYNAGSGNVEKYGGVPPFAETQNYVKKVLAYMEEYSQELEEPSQQRGGAQKPSAQKEAKAERDTYLEELEAKFLAQSGNEEILKAYERMKDKTYWKMP